MALSLVWLPDVLLSAGLKVAKDPGWENRGDGDVGRIVGVMCHHTGVPGGGKNMPTLRSLREGRKEERDHGDPLKIVQHLGQRLTTGFHHAIGL